MEAPVLPFSVDIKHRNKASYIEYRRYFAIVKIAYEFYPSHILLKFFF